MADVWRKALPSDDLERGKLAKAFVAGQAVLLARLEDGTVAASSPLCPHERADLSQGSVYMGAVDCPLHHYLYDLRTGQNRYPRNVFPADLAEKLGDLPLYRVKEEEGWIWVAVDEHEA
ncbi:MAG: Rieske (2Fe-2S) protein [Planctomycetes bacterium]|nr:Rieske (2Fe-2S) protein [Planctomycetota bacterium]